MYSSVACRPSAVTGGTGRASTESFRPPQHLRHYRRLESRLLSHRRPRTHLRSVWPPLYHAPGSPLGLLGLQPPTLCQSFCAGPEPYPLVRGQRGTAPLRGGVVRVEGLLYVLEARSDPTRAFPAPCGRGSRTHQPHIDKLSAALREGPHGAAHSRRAAPKPAYCF